MDAVEINVSQLKCAVLDAEWREQWKAGQNPPTMTFVTGEPARPPVLGSTFHKLAEQFLEWLAAPANREKAAPLDSELLLWQALYDNIAQPKLDSLMSDPKHMESLPDFLKCLRAFCRRLAELRAREPGFEAWSDVFLVNEFAIKEKVAVGGNILHVSGKLDAVRLAPDGVVEVVDYKLSGGANSKEDFIQLAIYARLMSAKLGRAEYRGVIEYYLPELFESPLDHEALISIYDELVEPLLPELFDKEPVTTAPETPAPGDAEPAECDVNGEPAADAEVEPELARRIEESYAAFNLKVQVTGGINAPQLQRILVEPELGVKVVSLANRAADLQVHLSLANPPLIKPAKGAVAIDIPKEKPDAVWWSEIIEDPRLAQADSPVAYPIGVSVRGQLLVGDFADANTCHMLVGGQSGSGKSEFLRSIVATLMRRNGPETVRMIIVDPKILTFSSLNDSPFLDGGGVITDTQQAVNVLNDAVEEMNRRYKLLSEETFANLKQRFEAGKTDVPFLLIVFDEFSDLILADKAMKKDFETAVARLAQKGRAAGIHLILATQRPDSKVVSGLIKSNLPMKVCLRVTSDSNSRIILDESGGQSLLGKGDLLCNLGHNLQRAQSPLVKANEFARVSGV